jgi:hypothetical protein
MEEAVSIADAIQKEIKRQAAQPGSELAVARLNGDPDSLRLIGKLDVRALAKAISEVI